MAQTTINNGDTGLVARNAINDNFTELFTVPNFTNEYDTDHTVSTVFDYQKRNILDRVIYRLKPSHIVGSGGSDYIQVLENIAAYSRGELWLKFTGDNVDLTLERKILVTTGTLSTVTAGVSRGANFQRFTKLIPKFSLQSGTGAAVVEVQIVVYNPKTMVEERVYVEYWDLDDGITLADRDWFLPRVSTKFLNSIISHPFYTATYLKGVSGTLNSADYTFHKAQSAYATIKTVSALSTSSANDRGYIVTPFSCDMANCLKVTLNNSVGTTTLTDAFVMIRL